MSTLLAVDPYEVVKVAVTGQSSLMPYFALCLANKVDFLYKRVIHGFR